MSSARLSLSLQNSGQREGVVAHQTQNAKHSIAANPHRAASFVDTHAASSTGFTTAGPLIGFVSNADRA